MHPGCESACSHGDAVGSVRQTMDELHFERGLWTADPFLPSLAIDNDVDRIVKLLKKGDDVDARDQSGHTSLHHASLRGNLAAVKELLANGADVNAKTSALGATSLHRAAGSGHFAIVETLLKASAIPNAKDCTGRTPMDAALAGNHADDSCDGAPRKLNLRWGNDYYSHVKLLDYLQCLYSADCDASAYTEVARRILRVRYECSRATSGGGSPDGPEKRKEEAKLSSFSKMKNLYRDYGYIIVPVHLTLTGTWFTIIYSALKAGVDLSDYLVILGSSEKIAKLGPLAGTILFLKLLSPLRYLATITTTTVVINELKKRGLIKPTHQLRNEYFSDKKEKK
ncbi:unnamed protein product [Notodromas monacha]|uniref:DUF1279 domain-containing protein n=1 Tax=Notodromas monacha TaxID=399045 RepID=A0A7R9G9M0_9CRUS|nr:unnamed protein product [Notodromas monacha]CAG0912757.1 unnamed protein product [Notodromas monacha]